MPLMRASLAQRLAASGPLPPAAAARMLRTLAEALHYAHRLAVLSLDLKPGNVLPDPDGWPQIADFGPSRRLGAAPGEAEPETPCTPRSKQGSGTWRGGGVR